MNPTAISRRESHRVFFAYSIESLVATASNFLTIGIFFFMKHRFNWDLLHNFCLSAGLGIVYVFGALAAHPLASKFGQRGPLIGAYVIMATAALIAGLILNPIVATVCVLAYAGCSATTWPIVEHLVTSGNLSAHQMSHRVAIYNINWAAVAAIVMAVNGVVIEKLEAGVFFIPFAVLVLAMSLAIFAPIVPENSHDDAAPSAAPEPSLARQRKLALWLSRICVPAMYIVIYALAAMLPVLPVMNRLTPAMQTLLSSVWPASRWVAFVALGATAYWHTRPRLLLVAAGTLFVSFIIITVRAGDWIGVQSFQLDLSMMIAGQIAFGLATGLIYMASLYFGMVLSEGSAEQGGYHEALIGLGMTLGPSVGVLTQWKWRGDQHASVGAVSSLIGASVLLATIASLRFRRPSR